MTNNVNYNLFSQNRSNIQYAWSFVCGMIDPNPSKPNPYRVPYFHETVKLSKEEAAYQAATGCENPDIVRQIIILNDNLIDRINAVLEIEDTTERKRELRPLIWDSIKLLDLNKVDPKIWDRWLDQIEEWGKFK